jgi:hypothetical protein
MRAPCRSASWARRMRGGTVVRETLGTRVIGAAKRTGCRRASPYAWRFAAIRRRIEGRGPLHVNARRGRRLDRCYRRSGAAPWRKPWSRSASMSIGRIRPGTFHVKRSADEVAASPGPPLSTLRPRAMGKPGAVRAEDRRSAASDPGPFHVKRSFDDVARRPGGDGCGCARRRSGVGGVFT